MDTPLLTITIGLFFASITRISILKTNTVETAWVALLAYRSASICLFFCVFVRLLKIHAILVPTLKPSMAISSPKSVFLFIDLRNKARWIAIYWCSSVLSVVFFLPYTMSFGRLRIHNTDLEVLQFERAN